VTGRSFEKKAHKKDVRRERLRGTETMVDRRDLHAYAGRTFGRWRRRNGKPSQEKGGMLGLHGKDLEYTEPINKLKERRERMLSLTKRRLYLPGEKGREKEKGGGSRREEGGARA